jgi:hypothetical protein
MRHGVVEIGQAKVDDLDVPGLGDQDIFDFEVPMDDVIAVAVIQRRGNLPGKLAGYTFAQTTVRDDVVEHLPPIDILEDHVVVVLVDDHLAHAADVRVVQQHAQCCLPKCPRLLAGVLGRRARRPWQYFHSELEKHEHKKMEQIFRTFSPVILWVANLTFPIEPAPRVLLRV